MTAQTRTGPRILVGVDDSPAAAAAVRWAADLAQWTGGQVALLHVRPRLLAPGVVTRVNAPAVDPAAADGLVAGLAAELRDRAVEACAEVVDGDPARVLIARSVRVDLLVLGGESRRRQRGLLLGAVAQQCVRRAHCPVVLVPPPADPGQPVPLPLPGRTATATATPEGPASAGPVSAGPVSAGPVLASSTSSNGSSAGPPPAGPSHPVAIVAPLRAW